eukprot:6199152-Pleurochrysis_carterae.AAC.3
MVGIGRAHLRLDANEHHPLLVGRGLVVDDLRVVERWVAVEDLDWLRLACAAASREERKISAQNRAHPNNLALARLPG